MDALLCYCQHDSDILLVAFCTDFKLVSCSAYSTLKMETVHSSETSVDFQRTTLPPFSEHSTFQAQVYMCCLTHIAKLYPYLRNFFIIGCVREMLIPLLYDQGLCCDGEDITAAIKYMEHSN
jgi:hypothetical protein